MTRLEFLAYIKRTFKRTDKDTEIYEALNETIKDIGSRYPFECYNFQSWIPCVVEQEDYSLPSDLLHFDHPMRLLEGSGTNDSGYPLEYITKDRYDVEEPNPNRTSPETGKPTKYTIYSNSILLTPIPDSTTYLLEINWCKVPTSLDADADEHEFGSVWDEILKRGSLARLFESVGLYEESQYWNTKYEDPQQGVPKMIRLEKDLRRRWIDNVANNTL